MYFVFAYWIATSGEICIENQRRRVCVKEVKEFTMVGTQNRKTVTLRLTIRRENAKLDKLNFEPKYQMVYDNNYPLGILTKIWLLECKFCKL